ncbi:UNVERIFIED_CONTAM: peptide maturation system protein (TIGR04066 family) [Acetivibrio alkalicellulosi]
MNKYKTLVYPYDINFSSILRHKDLLNNHEIVALVSPRGWSLSGKDGAFADGGDELGIIVDYNFEDSLKKCDTVLFCESEHILDFESIILPNIFMAIDLKKNILINFSLCKKVLDLIIQKCNTNGVEVQYNGMIEEDVICYDIPFEHECIHEINTPVVFILGIGEKTNKFEIQLSLRENISKMGYRISQIGSRACCEFLGFHSFPHFMYSNKVTETNKIVLFNHYIKNIEMTEQPDLIIIGIPGAIMPVSNTLTNRFGVLAFEVSQAVKPDSTIISCHYQEYLEKYFIELEKFAKYRLGCSTDCFNIANSVLDYSQSPDLNKTDYVILPSSYVDKKISPYKKYNQKIFNILNKKDNQDMSEYIIDLLSKYGQTECI